MKKNRIMMSYRKIGIAARQRAVQRLADKAAIQQKTLEALEDRMADVDERGDVGEWRFHYLLYFVVLER